MNGSGPKGGTPGFSDSDQTLSNPILTDGGVTSYQCDECGEVEKCNVDDAGQRRCPDCGRAVTAVVTDGGLDAETVLNTVAAGDVVEIAGSPYRVVDVDEDEDEGVLRVYDLVERAERIKAAGAGDVDVYLHRSETDAIETRVDQERERRDDQEDDVDEGDGVEADGGVSFADRVDEMIEEIEYEIEDSTPAEAMLYARCCAAFEEAHNHTDLPAENALGVMTAALFEAADTVGYARSDVIETAREHYIDEGGDA